MRFLHQDMVRYGEKCGNRIFELSQSYLISNERNGKEFNLSEVRLLAPCEPAKIVCVGLNYPTGENGEISQDPILFMKPSSSIIGPDDNIVQWPMVKEMTFEAELVVVMGKTAHQVRTDDAEKYIFGYTIANDVTARDLQQVDSQWTRAKSFDTFLPLGPVVRADIAWKGLRISSWINGSLYQDGYSEQMLLNVPYLVSYISQIMTLNPGDLILTGTPGGYGGLMNPGDTVEIEIQGIGRISNKVVGD